MNEVLGWFGINLMVSFQYITQNMFCNLAKVSHQDDLKIYYFNLEPAIEPVVRLLPLFLSPSLSLLDLSEDLSLDFLSDFDFLSFPVSECFLESAAFSDCNTTIYQLCFDYIYTWTGIGCAHRQQT